MVGGGEDGGDFVDDSEAVVGRGEEVVPLSLAAGADVVGELQGSSGMLF